MAYLNWDCKEFNGGGWRGNEDNELVACNLVPGWEHETVEMPPITNEEAIASLDARAP